MSTPPRFIELFIGRVVGASLGILVTGYLAASLFPQSKFYSAMPHLMIVSGILCAIAAVCQGSRKSAVTSLLALSAGIVLGITLLLLIDPLSLPSFSGSDGWLQVMSSRIVLPQWLGGTSLLSQLLLHTRVESYIDIGTFARLLGASVMIFWIGMIALLESRSLGLVLLLASPIWIVFCLGHLEYYPLVAGMAPFALTFAMGRDEKERSAVELGVLAALATWLSLGFLPLTAALILMGMSTRLSGGIIAALLCLACLAGLIAASYPGGLFLFINDVPHYLSLGHAQPPPPHQQLSSSLFSPLLSLDDALRAPHLLEVAKLIFFGAGPLLVGVLPLGALLFLRHDVLRPSLVPLFPTLVATLLALGFAAYCVLLIPMTDPLRNIDRLFLAYFSFWFVTGKLAEGRVSPMIEGTITYAVLGSSLVLAFGMVTVGVPRLSS